MSANDELHMEEPDEHPGAIARGDTAGGAVGGTSGAEAHGEGWAGARPAEETPDETPQGQDAD
jgi:hypothetical protein